ncbi:hypothetical protein RJ639_028483 [Escallonia herrerae]|uniref:Uncharacterized protein n=1 Tax=Escallonia herrerae TaxID=1293975 RepID=A0AA88X7C1_9ASTE|nr:hypothetical protein RJ639_028483 [Escallonia herrerae]
MDRTNNNRSTGGSGRARGRGRGRGGQNDHGPAGGRGRGGSRVPIHGATNVTGRPPMEYQAGRPPRSNPKSGAGGGPVGGARASVSTDHTRRPRETLPGDVSSNRWGWSYSLLLDLTRGFEVLSCVVFVFPSHAMWAVVWAVVVVIMDFPGYDLRFNEFVGGVLRELFDKDLDAIFINHNSFVFDLPDNFGNSLFSIIVLANNKFHGCVPAGILLKPMPIWSN